MFQIRTKGKSKDFFCTDVKKIYTKERRSILLESPNLQNALRDDTLWDFRELLAQVMQNPNVNLVASLCHSYVARSGLLALFSALGHQAWQQFISIINMF